MTIEVRSAFRRGVFFLIVGAALELGVARPAGSADSGNVTYRARVNNMVDFITHKQSASSPLGLNSWNNAAMASTRTDSTAIFRLVMNMNILLTAPTQSVLTNASGEQLATYYRIVSDGNGSSAAGFTVSTGGVNHFLYVGGGSTQWQTANSLTPQTFLGTGRVIQHVSADGNSLLTLTVRGWNGEDLGADSDFTEAPNSGSYTASVSLLAVQN